jgi:hypothetical protein
MNPKGKKFLSLFLIFSLMMLSVNLYAKERRGSKLLITKKDGQQVEGELITVKPTSVLLLNTEGKDESIEIADIREIKIVKKSKVREGALFGLVTGVAIGVASLEQNNHDIFTNTLNVLIIASISALVVGLLGAVAGIDKTIQIEGMTDSEIQRTMKKLRKKARVRNYK